MFGKYLNKSHLLSFVSCFLLLLSFQAAGESRVLHKDLEKSGQRPEWADKTIFDEGEFIYSVGRSQVKKNLKEAKDEALMDATQNFVKYCKVDVQSFDRSIEVYSKNKSKESSASDIRSQTIVRTNTFVRKALPVDWYLDKDKKSVYACVLLKIPKEEFDRITSEKNISLSLDILLYYEDDNGKMQVMNEGSVLSSKDSFAIYVKPSDTCYLYIFEIDALGKSFRLFPNTSYDTASNPLAPSFDCWIPNDKKLFELDQTTGKEYFYIFASAKPIPDFEGEKPVSFEKKDLDSLIEIKKMGIAGLKDKRSAEQVVVPKYSTMLTEVKKKLQAEGVFVYETWFWHK